VSEITTLNQVEGKSANQNTLTLAHRM